MTSPGTAPPSATQSAPQRVLLQAPSWIGDLVMATAAFADVRRAWPHAHIALLVKPGRQRVVAGSDAFDEVIVDRSKGSLRGFLATCGELRRRELDLAVLFSDSLRVATLAWAAGIPRRVGYRRNLRTPLLTTAVRYPGPRGSKSPEPMPLRHDRLLDAIGVPGGDHRPVLRVTPEEEDRARSRRVALRIAEGEALVGLNPGANFGSSKIWPPEHFARLGDMLTERWGARCLILVGPGEEAIADAIEERMTTHPVSTARSLVPLDELKPFVRDLRLLITTDTGPRHYAVAFRVPLVCVMGSTDPRYTNINLDETELIRRDELDCIACHLKTCPIDHRCMTGITPEMVLERVERLQERFRMF